MKIGMLLGFFYSIADKQGLNRRGAVCRETRDSAGTPWCFTTAAPGNTWNYCSVESCRLV